MLTFSYIRTELRLLLKVLKKHLRVDSDSNGEDSDSSLEVSDSKSSLEFSDSGLGTCGLGLDYVTEKYTEKSQRIAYIPCPA